MRLICPIIATLPSSVSKDYLTKKPDKRQKFESFYLEGDHEAIVEPSVWDAVQEKMQRHKEVEEAVGHRGGRPHFLYGKVFCGACGAPMTRRTVNGLGGEKCKTWTCRERHKGRKGNGCKGRNVFEEELLAAVSGEIGELVNEENVDMVARVEVKGQGVKVKMTEGAKSA